MYFFTSDFIKLQKQRLFPPPTYKRGGSVSSTALVQTVQ